MAPGFSALCAALVGVVPKMRGEGTCPYAPFNPPLPYVSGAQAMRSPRAGHVAMVAIGPSSSALRDGTLAPWHTANTHADPQDPDSVCSKVPEAFDPEKAVEAATLAKLVYNIAASRDAQTMGYNVVTSICGEGGTYALVLRKRREVHIAFRGTANMGNVAANIDFDLTPLTLCGGRLPRDCLVHAGYLRAYAGIAPHLLRVLGKIVDEDPNGERGVSLSLTGHSLGGALVALALLEIGARFDFASVTVHTFGAGRLGNTPFARRFRSWLPPRSSFWAIASPADPIVHLPPSALGYRPHWPLALVPRSRAPAPQRVASASVASWPLQNGRGQELFSPPRAPRDPGVETLLTDPFYFHRISSYVAAMERLAQRRSPRQAAAPGS